MATNLEVKVHLVDDVTAPYQLEIDHGDVVILDHVQKMEDANGAVLLAIKAMKEAYHPDHVPEVLSADQYEFDYKYDIPSLIENFKGLLNQATIARISGMNKSLLSQYLNKKELKKLSYKQAKRIEESLHKFGEELIEIKLDY